MPDRQIDQSKWHNPYQIGSDAIHTTAIAKYRERLHSWMISAPAITTWDLGRLASKPLVCW